MNARFCKELGGRWDLTLEQLYLQVRHTPSWSTTLIQHAQYVLLKHANEARCYTGIQKVQEQTMMRVQHV